MRGSLVSTVFAVLGCAHVPADSAPPIPDPCLTSYGTRHHSEYFIHGSVVSRATWEAELARQPESRTLSARSEPLSRAGFGLFAAGAATLLTTGYVALGMLFGGVKHPEWATIGVAPGAAMLGIGFGLSSRSGTLFDAAIDHYNRVAFEQQRCPIN
jgi:hypothetical protein